MLIICQNTLCFSRITCIHAKEHKETRSCTIIPCEKPDRNVYQEKVCVPIIKIRNYKESTCIEL
jgi:hypothetical protein